MGRSFEAFLYSRRNIVGCFLALAGPALFFTGIVTSIVWLPMTAALYLIGVLLVPGERGLGLVLDATGNMAEVRDGLDRLLKSIQGSVPGDIYARVTSIRDSILVTLGTNGNGADAGSTTADPNLYLIRQTALSYLPEALNNYLALPQMYATRSIGGRPSAHDLLLGQLNLMDRKMQEVAEAFVEHDTDKLEAHGRFLAEKFAPSSLQIDASQPVQVGAGSSVSSASNDPGDPATAGDAKASGRTRGVG